MVEGKLLVSLPQQEADWLRSVFRFAYIMGGFGKSSRRVWHKCDLPHWHPGFMPTYQTRAIGCHWECSDLSFVGIESKQNLKAFLSNLERDTQNFHSQLNASQRNKSQESPDYMTHWREAWHPHNVTVYALETDKSQAINLFHEKEIFKYTPAIGGRGSKIENGKEKRDDHPTSVSSVWHRMLPIGGNRYLEIVTVFHGDRTLQSPWRHRTEGDQLQPFIKSLENAQLKLTWGTRPVFNT